MDIKNTRLAVVGLGYVGLPIAVAWGKTKIAPVLGFDISQPRIQELQKGIDRTREVEKKDLKKTNVRYSFTPRDLKWANFIVAAIPTPINASKKPDLSYVKSASKIIGQNLSKGAIVVFESTVYPGVTEDICGKIIERYSGLKTGKDFKLGYSPERINPGDKKHTVDKIVKVISAQDKKALHTVQSVYGLICKAGLHKAPDIKTAEASKVIENVQRDLNIALANELSLIFAKMGIDTREVMKAAATKWNIQYFEPGLVGGHCIGVDPYYLTHRAKQLGHHSKVILAGRAINEYMPSYVATLTFGALREAKKKIRGSKILVAGLTFKENVKDTRNSKIAGTIQKLKSGGCNVYGHDPLLSEKEIRQFGVMPVLNLARPNMRFDAFIPAVIHKEFQNLNASNFKKLMSPPPVLIDIKGFLSKQKRGGMIYRSL